MKSNVHGLTIMFILTGDFKFKLYSSFLGNQQDDLNQNNLKDSKSYKQGCIKWARVLNHVVHKKYDSYYMKHRDLSQHEIVVFQSSLHHFTKINSLRIIASLPLIRSSFIIVKIIQKIKYKILGLSNFGSKFYCE